MLKGLIWLLLALTSATLTILTQCNDLSSEGVTKWLQTVASEAIANCDTNSLHILKDVHERWIDCFTMEHFKQAIRSANDDTLALLLESRYAYQEMIRDNYKLVKYGHKKRRSAPMLVKMLFPQKNKWVLYCGNDDLPKEARIALGVIHSERLPRGIGLTIGDYYLRGEMPRDPAPYESVDNSESLKGSLKSILLESVKKGDTKLISMFRDILIVATPEVLHECLLISLRNTNYKQIKMMTGLVDVQANGWEAARLAAELRLPSYIVVPLLEQGSRRMNICDALQFCVQRKLVDVFAHLAKFYEPPVAVVPEGAYLDPRTGNILWETEPKVLKTIITPTWFFMRLVSMTDSEPILKILLDETGPLVKEISPVSKMKTFQKEVIYAYPGNKPFFDWLVVMAGRAYDSLPHGVYWDFEFKQLAMIIHGSKAIGHFLQSDRLNYDIARIIFDILCDSVLGQTKS